MLPLPSISPSEIHLCFGDNYIIVQAYMAIHFYPDCIFLMYVFVCAGVSIRQRMFIVAVCTPASSPLRNTLECD